MKILLLILALLAPCFSYAGQSDCTICPVKNYVMVCSEDPRKLSQEVKNYLNVGWAIYGNPTLCKGGGVNADSYYMCQALVKY